MRLRSMTWLGALVCLGLLAGCGSADPLMIPNAGDVRSIEAHVSNSTFDPAAKSYTGKLIITDSKKIADVVHVLESLNNDMSIPSDNFPSPTHAIVFDDSTGKNLVVYVGLNWIGGRNNVSGAASTDRLRKVSEEQRQQFLQTVGIRDYQF